MKSMGACITKRLGYLTLKIPFSHRTVERRVGKETSTDCIVTMYSVGITIFLNIYLCLLLVRQLTKHLHVFYGIIIIYSIIIPFRRRG